MITVKTEVNTKIYNRIAEFKQEINEKLKQEAIKAANGEELDWSTAKYGMLGLKPDSHCGCSKRSEIILTVNLLNEYIN